MEHSQPKIHIREDISIFDNTMLKAFQSCPRYFYWRHVRHLAPTTMNIPLLFGIAIHAGLDAYYQTNDIVKVVEAFVSEFGATEGDDKRNLDNGVRILKNYVANHPIENEPWTVTEVEKVFEIVLDPAKKLHYFGRIDLIIDWPGYGILVVDHKTSSWISDNYMRAHAVDRQFTGYVVGMKEHYEKVYGAMINVLEVPKTMTRDPKVMREPTSRNQVDCALWVLETIQLVDQIESCHKNNRWPMNAPFYCTAWNRMCEYFELCNSHQHPEKVKIPTEIFEEKKWTPFQSENA